MLVIPVLSAEGFISSPQHMVSEILNNYVKGSARQSTLFDTKSLMNDLARTNNNITEAREAIKSSIRELVSYCFDDVEVTIDTTVDEPVVTVKWTYEGNEGKIENVRLNELNTNNL